MSKLQIDGTALAVSVLGVALGFTLLPGPFAWLASIAGLVLAIVLLGYDREGYRSVMESLGFSAAVALCLTLASAVLLRSVSASPGQPGNFEGRIGSEWMPLIWVGLTILIAVIDRARMSGRVQYAAMPASPVYSSSLSLRAPAPAPVPAAPAPAAPMQARPVVTETAPPAPPQPSVPQPALRPTFTQPSFGQTEEETLQDSVPARATAIPRSTPTSTFAPAAQAPTYAPTAAIPTYPPTAQTTAAHSVPETPVPPPPMASPNLPAGKPTMIYVGLVGEGLNVLRAVGAEHLGRDYYKIVEEMPEGETWQFGPGQVVRCKKKNLSSGKAMVATEEAPRSR